MIILITILNFLICLILNIIISYSQWSSLLTPYHFMTLKLGSMKQGLILGYTKKPTNTNLILNFNALCPTKWKSGLILCSLNRAKRICSSDFLFDKEVSMLKKMFLINGYPSSFFDKILASFQSYNKFSQNISFENCFCLPYLGKESHHFANLPSIKSIISS